MKKYFGLSMAAGALIVVLVACSSTPKLGDYSPGTNAQEATAQLSREMEAAQNQQMDVLAPQNFADAQKHLKKSRDIQSKENFKNDNALEELAMAKASFNQAKGAANKAAPQLNELIEARQAALAAAAMQNHHKELVALDEDFMDMSRKIEKGQAEVDLKEKSKLQKKYLDLELTAIKTEKLANTRALMKKAKEVNAERVSPKSWASAESKLSNADAVITSDRHDAAAINSAVILAEGEARKAYDVANTVRSAKSHTNEDVALDIYEKKGKISALSKEVSEGKTDEQLAALALSAKERELSAKGQELSQSEQQRRSLESERKFNQTLQDAQKQFEAKDALVYRQGDNLVIRLKSVNFPSGKADLPAHSIPILSKTKQLIQDLNPQKVIVEGHTDAVGSHEINKRISQNRAETVAKYLSADSTINASNIETRGMGDEQPLTSNKTKAGRSENRRVDIVITPNPIE